MVQLLKMTQELLQKKVHSHLTHVCMPIFCVTIIVSIMCLSTVIRSW